MTVLDKRIFVAGHRGLVGSAIVRALRAKGCNNIVTRSHAELDLSEQAQVRAFFAAERIDEVYMAAARVGGIHANNSYPAEFIYDNLMVQTNLVHEAWKSGVQKLLFLGSSCIYPRLAPQPIKEEYLMAGMLEPTNEPYAMAKIAGIKLFADGSISGKTAWCSCAYKHTGSLFGMSLLSSAALAQAYEWSVANGAQMAVHAMGDAALQLVIDFFADKKPWLPAGVPSVRLEHATLLKPAQIAQMNAMPMQWGVATQIIFMFAEYEAYTENLVASEFEQSYALKTFYEEIDHIALSSDAPATTWADPDNVFISIQAAVQRRAYNGAPIVDSQALNVPQALLLYTARAASLSPFEGRLGQIAPGFEASFAVLDRDIFTVPVADIGSLRVLETWIAGEQVYRAA